MEEKIFSYDEAATLLTEVKRLTEAAFLEVEAIQDGESELTDRSMAVVIRWSEAVRAKGVSVKGLWLVDFNNGSGYYCWRYPEERLEYYHTYETGFSGRMRIH